MTEPQPPFGFRRALGYGAGNVGAGMVFAFTNAVLPFYLAGYGLPNALIGLLSQERPPLAGLVQIAVGAVSDRTRTRLGRRRPFILAGVPVVAAALLILALRPPAPIMIAVLVLLTTCLAVAYGPYLALLPDLVPEDQRGRVGGVLAAGSTAGQLLMLGLASQVWSEQPALVFGIVAVGLLAAFGVTVLAVAEPAAAPAQAGGAFGSLRTYVAGLLEHRELLKYLVATGLFWLGSGGVVPFLTRFAVNELGTDETAAFGLLMVAIVSTAVFAVPAGWLGDRYGRKPALLAGLVLLGATFVVGSQARTVEQALVALAFSGLANALCTTMLLPLLSDLIPRARAGELVGLGSAVWELTQPVGAVLAGMAADVTGTLRSALVVAGLLIVLSGVALLPVRAPRLPDTTPRTPHR